MASEDASEHKTRYAPIEERLSRVQEVVQTLLLLEKHPKIEVEVQGNHFKGHTMDLRVKNDEWLRNNIKILCDSIKILLAESEWLRDDINMLRDEIEWLRDDSKMLDAKFKSIEDTLQPLVNAHNAHRMDVLSSWCKLDQR
ncbi:hypothetical protein P168DRAFT_316624 [Aspergillus campestris IBT 28561]|uniref:Uncharacterized protein n=1 Tax=Aspergillus campestris (strain IBT 28561) TaxID=1392248 RepID=A0A2I1D9R8_ASPC2|nr:uncharacterized protein P168DRAFT_316624 [Aspergillus campestris IBT 28561]PKY06630.1 hypothetical protein P168DRAFT_316624 [Aspergillus campestris IBT 28561]